MYGVAQKHVAHQPPGRLVVALDPVNLEKCYTEKLEGISTVLKSTPPGPEGKRLAAGYPALTATIVNLPEPVVTYANWFSYETADFVSENWELYRALRITLTFHVRLTDDQAVADALLGFIYNRAVVTSSPGLAEASVDFRIRVDSSRHSVYLPLILRNASSP